MGKYGPLFIANALCDTDFVAAFAFDPGDSTGICSIGRSALTKISTEDQEGLFTALSYTQFEIQGIVFYEGFISRPTQVSRTQLAPQNIGAIKLWAHLNRFSRMEIQPSQTHRLKREDVKAAGWTWKTEHEFDAIRIMIMGVLSLVKR